MNPVLEGLRADADRFEKILMQRGGLTERAASEILSRARDARVRVEFVERERLTSMTGGGTHQGIVAEVQTFEYSELSPMLAKAKAHTDTPLIVVLDGIQDPHNFGAIIRSAHALGADGIVVGKDRAVGVTGVVVKASAGASAHIAIARVTNIARALEQLKADGYWVAALDPEGTTSLWAQKLDGAMAIVVGAEGDGVRHNVLNHCDYRLKIPMEGHVASLNASVSAALLLGEISRQRASSAQPVAATESPTE